jgi:hypothetical protein
MLRASLAALSLLDVGTPERRANDFLLFSYSFA